MIKYLKQGLIGLFSIGVMAAAVWYFMQPEAMIVIVAERNSINPVINGTGKISGGRKITIYADVTGLVESKEVQVGDRVKTGDKLVRYVMDDQRLQVDLARTEAEFSKKILAAGIDQKTKYESN